MRGVGVVAGCVGLALLVAAAIRQGASCDFLRDYNFKLRLQF